MRLLHALRGERVLGVDVDLDRAVRDELEELGDVRAALLGRVDVVFQAVSSFVIRDGTVRSVMIEETWPLARKADSRWTQQANVLLDELQWRERGHSPRGVPERDDRALPADHLKVCLESTHKARRSSCQQILDRGANRRGVELRTYPCRRRRRSRSRPRRP